MKKKFQIFSIFIFFILNNCSLSFQSIMEGINYSKNSVDFLSYVATDKTTTDHALSYFFDKDCSLSRTLQLKQICEEIKKESLTKKNVSNINKKISKVYKKRNIRIKKIKVPSMAY